MESNIFTTKLYDIIIPDNAIIAKDGVKGKAKEDSDFVKILTKAVEEDDSETFVNLK